MMNQKSILEKSQQITTWKLTKEEHREINTDDLSTLKDSELIHRYDYQAENSDSIFSQAILKVWYSKSNKIDSRLYSELEITFRPSKIQDIKQKIQRFYSERAMTYSDKIVFPLKQNQTEKFKHNFAILNDQFESIDLNFKSNIYKIVGIEKTEDEYQEEIIHALKNGSFQDALNIAKEAQANKKYDVIWTLATIVNPQPYQEASSTEVISTESNENNETPSTEIECNIDVSKEDIINLYKEIINNENNLYRKAAAKHLFDLLFDKQPLPHQLKEYRQQLIKTAMSIAAEDTAVKSTLNNIARQYCDFHFSDGTLSLSGNLVDDVLALLDLVKEQHAKITALEAKNAELAQQVKELKEQLSKASMVNTKVSNQHFLANKSENNNSNNQATTKGVDVETVVTRPRSGSAPK